MCTLYTYIQKEVERDRERKIKKERYNSIFVWMEAKFVFCRLTPDPRGNFLLLRQDQDQDQDTYDQTTFSEASFSKFIFTIRLMITLRGFL